jgi:hypothetical protein
VRGSKPKGPDTVGAAVYPDRVLVASATIDGHAMALRLERADTFTIGRWVDARPVMPWCQALTVVHTPNSRDTLLTAARAPRKPRIRRDPPSPRPRPATKTADSASRSRSTTFATRSRSASQQNRLAPLHQAVRLHRCQPPTTRKGRRSAFTELAIVVLSPNSNGSPSQPSACGRCADGE